MAGNAKETLAQLSEEAAETPRPRLSESLWMLQQSSKDTLEDTYLDNAGQDIPPGQPSNLGNEPDSFAGAATPPFAMTKPSAKPSQKPSQASPRQSPFPDVRRELFPNQPKPKKPSTQAPKPEGYWKLLGQVMCICTAEL